MEQLAALTAGGGGKICPHCNGDDIHQEWQCPLHPSVASGQMAAERAAARQRERNHRLRVEAVNANPQVVAAALAQKEARDFVANAERRIREFPPSVSAASALFRPLRVAVLSFLISFGLAPAGTRRSRVADRN